MTLEEKKRHLGFGKKINSANVQSSIGNSLYSSIIAESQTSFVPVSQLPTEVDWRGKNIITSVKNQGGCG